MKIIQNSKYHAFLSELKALIEQVKETNPSYGQTC